MLVLAGMSTGNRIGLAVVAAVFIAFALSVSFLAPERWPDFPGRNALGVFVIACFVLFGGMLAAVFVFGKETEEAKGASEAAAVHTIKVTEREYRITLPATGELKGGTYTFEVHNAGQVAHNLAIQGSGTISGTQTTATIQPGGDATLKVNLGPGRYTLYCSIDDHRKLGMQAALAVG